MSRDSVPLVKPQSKADLRHKAVWLLSRYFPDCLKTPQAIPIDNLVQFKLPNDFNVDFSVAPLPHPAEAVVIPKTNDAPAQLIMAPDVFEGMLSGDGRARFTGAHEFLHAAHHARQLSTQLVDGKHSGLYRKSSIPAYANPEWQANRFAAELLMPDEMVRIAFEECGGRPWKLAELFGVSPRAMSIRLEQLGLW